MSSTVNLERLLSIASTAREAGSFEAATNAYAQALALAPHLSTAWFNLGFCQRRLGRFLEALASYERAIECGLEGPEEACLNRALILSDYLRRDTDAERELRRALKLNSAYAPALLNLGNLYEDMGRRTEAIGVYELVLALQPENWSALARLLSLSQDGAKSALERAELALQRSDVSIADKASLGFSLGHVLDRSGEYERAFEVYTRANADSRAAHGGSYDRQAEEARARAIMASFSDAEPAAADKAWAPIFICGMFRSGSTLAEQVLAGHPRITPGGELDLVPQIVRTLLSPFPDAVSRIEQPAFANFAKMYQDRVRGAHPSADLITDKRPDNFWYVGVIKRMFPNAKIVHTVRNPLDNVLSVYFLHLDARMSYARDLADIAHQLRLSRRLAQHWSALYPGDIVAFDYDAFVASPRQTAQQFLARLGLEWDESCLAFHQRTNAVRTASVWQVRQPLYASSSGRWKNYSFALVDLQRELADIADF